MGLLTKLLSKRSLEGGEVTRSDRINRGVRDWLNEAGDWVLGHFADRHFTDRPFADRHFADPIIRRQTFR